MLGLNDNELDYIGSFIEAYKPALEMGAGEYKVIFNDISIYTNSKGHKTFRAIFEVIHGPFTGRKIYFKRVLEVKTTEKWSPKLARKSVIKFLSDFGIDLEYIDKYTFQDNVNEYDWRGTLEGSPQSYRIYYNPGEWDIVTYLGYE